MGTGDTPDARPEGYRPDGTARVRAWVQGHPLVPDWVIPLAIAAPAVGVTLDRHYDSASPWWWLAAAACVVPLVWRRTYPDAVFAIVTAAAVITLIPGIRHVAPATFIALLVALYAVAAYRPRNHALIAAAVLEAWALPAVFRIAPPGEALSAAVLVTGTAAAAVMAGVNVQTRRAYLEALEDRAARLERERDQQAQLAVAGERTRIAREVHDIVTHSLSVMVALADGAAAQVGTSPDKSHSAMREVAATGRQAIGEMQRLVRTLRVDDPVDRYPAPGIAQLDDLLGQVRAAGLPVRLVVTGQPRSLGQGAHLAVYRIVQEALTNTRKHARDATGAVVLLHYFDEGIDVEVTDDGHGAPAADAGTGHGLTGMRERAAAYGGSVEAGPRADGGWRVHARLNPGLPGGSEEP
jgi:signal transduction histidine kinase